MVGEKFQMKSLKRNLYSAKKYGVCSGIADYFNTDADLVRIYFIIGTIVTCGLLLFAYILLAIVLPSE